jgi:hypothetical protein
MRRGIPNPDVTDFRLCKEFGFAVDRQPNKRIEKFLVILNESDRQAQEEIEKAKRESKH